MKWYEGLSRDVAAMIWRGDVDELHKALPCVCCCADHTFDHCDAKLWGGCRGQYSMTRADHESWAEHYAKHHGTTRDQFFAYD